MNKVDAVLAVLAASAVLALTGCSGSRTTTTTTAGPTMDVPVFSEDDPQVETAGFVRKTLRLNEERDGVTYTLMAFVVGDTMTLGAMVTGPFRGDVAWQIGDRWLTFQFNTERSLTDVPVTIYRGETIGIMTGHGTSFRDTSWVNLEIPAARWGVDATPIKLVYTPQDGAAVHLPDETHHYVLRKVPGPTE